MNEEKNNVEIFTEDNIITLYDDQDQPIEFYEIASVEYEERFYELLQPAAPIEGIDEDEAVIFEYTVNDDETEKVFKPIDDEELLEKVFELYVSAAADFDATEAQESGCSPSACASCGCGCGGHDDEE